MTYRYSITSNYPPTNGRADHNSASASVAGQVLNAGKVAWGDELYTEVTASSTALVGDKWLKVMIIDGVTFSGYSWMPVIRMGSVICNLTDNQVTPPPVIEDEIVKLTGYYKSGRTQDFFPVV